MSNCVPYVPYVPYVPRYLPKIHVNASSDMGHIELKNRYHMKIDPKLYSLISDDVKIVEYMYNGHCFRFYRAKQQHQVNEYTINGQIYTVDFSSLE
jgi:hypothetical protein